MDEENKKLKLIRLKQRFSNFERAYIQLQKALKSDTASDDLLRSGLIQTFEYTFELAWKTMKDKLESSDVVTSFPREVIQEAFIARYITDENIWTESLKMRNESSHRYDDEFIKEAEKFIRFVYAPALKDLYDYFKKSI